ncbi:TrkA family potassium uptake protein [Candidatus Micrarchaeota archaeon]|nr:MAG: TrkA family potassium uptake protein [Candidatus Micrarchaeota archaeon]
MMYIIIIGAGKVGYHLTKILLEEGHDVVVVDKDGDVCHEIATELECVTIRGDGTKPRILEEAGIYEADAIVTLTGSDETNLIASLTAKQMGAKYVATRLGALHYDEEILKKLGLDLVIYPEAAAAGYIAELITKPDVLDLAFISRGDAEILELEVKPKSKIAGKEISEIEQPQGTAIIAIIEKGRLVIPKPSRKIKAGDKVLILAKKEKVKEIKKMI